MKLLQLGHLSPDQRTKTTKSEKGNVIAPSKMRKPNPYSFKKYPTTKIIIGIIGNSKKSLFFISICFINLSIVPKTEDT